MLHILISIINWGVAHKDAILALVGGSAALSGFAQIILHKVETKWGAKNKVFAYTLVQLLTVAATLVAYLTADSNIAVVFPWLATITAAAHRFFISPVYTRQVLPFLEYKAQSKTVEDLNQVQELSPAGLADPASSFVS